MPNYKSPFMAAMADAGFASQEMSMARTTFTNLRKDGQRRVKLWYANDVWESSSKHQRALESALKKRYGAAYLRGYFVQGERCRGSSNKSLCIVLAKGYVGE